MSVYFLGSISSLCWHCVEQNRYSLPSNSGRAAAWSAWTLIAQTGSIAEVGAAKLLVLVVSLVVYLSVLVAIRIASEMSGARTHLGVRSAAQPWSGAALATRMPAPLRDACRQVRNRSSSRA